MMDTPPGARQSTGWDVGMPHLSTIPEAQGNFLTYR